jgi:hypothetical protein
MMKSVKTVAAIAALLASAGVARAEIDHSKDYAWHQLVENAARVGIKVERSCFTPSDAQPYCSLSMTTPVVNGVYFIMSEYYNMDDHMINRAFCFFETRKSIARKRRCYDPDSALVTEELFDSLHEQWTTLRTYTLPETDNVLSELSRQQQQFFQPPFPFTGSVPQAPSHTLKQWDVTLASGNIMRRTMRAIGNGTRQLLATEVTSDGVIIGHSRCNFNHQWSDCVTNNGTRYTLKPSAIAWLYGQIGCPSASLCGR